MKLIQFILIFTFIISFQNPCSAADLCERFEWMACPDAINGGRNATNASAPTQSAGMQSNPASLTVNRGVGIETLTYAGHYEAALVTGTGVIGGGFSTSNTEGTYFGITTTEDQDDQLDREIAKKPYRSDRFTFVLAGNLFGNRKKKKRFISANLGVIAKYNKQTNALNGGLGLSLTVGPFSAGAARYRDDHRDRNSGEFSSYYNQNITFGVKLANIAVDYVYMEGHAHPVSYVRLLTATLFARDAMFTYGIRSEYSKFLDKEEFLEGRNTTDPKRDLFLGGQYIYKKKVIAGLFYNYFLLREFSVGLSIFI